MCSYLSYLSLMYPHVQEQNLSHHVKFLQTTEYELFDLSGLFSPLQTA